MPWRCSAAPISAGEARSRSPRPLAALFLSDLVLGFYHGMATVYFSVALIVLLGSVALNRVSALRVGGAALASSILFFVVTNFGMWLSSGIYPRTLAGLEACYVAAIPFFQNTVAGDLFYAALLFGGFKLAERLVPQLRARSAAAGASCNIAARLVEAPLNLSPLVGNQRLSQGKIR